VDDGVIERKCGEEFGKIVVLDQEVDAGENVRIDE